MSRTDHSIKVNAQKSIKKGEEITIHYLSFIYGNIKRKKAMRNNWFFDCTCTRCQDPTEMGSYLSATKCSECENGYMLPIDPMNLSSDWHCSICKHKISVESINETISQCFTIIYNSEKTVEQCEKILPQLLQKLHPNHNMG